MKSVKGRVVEIFSSIQGEGKFLGIKQLFIRFADCNLSCAFCDTVWNTWEEYSIEQLLKKVKTFLIKEKFHSISITGGEPLLQLDFLQVFLPGLKKLKQKIYLETNGTLPLPLCQIIGQLDIIALDFKLPSSSRQKNFWQAHKDCLKIAGGKECFVKIVLTPQTSFSDFSRAVEIISKIRKDTTLVLQPEAKAVPLLKNFCHKIKRFQAGALKKLPDVRLIPQVHKFLNLP